VRVLTRDPTRAAHLSYPGVHVVTGDVRDPASLIRAAAGIRTVISAVHGLTGPGRVLPVSIDRDGNAQLVAAARAVGADVVLTSIVGASPTHPLELFRMKYAAEQHLAASGVPWTIVRADAFRDLFVDILTSTAGRAGRPVIFGHSDTPTDFVRVDDVAAAVERAVTDATTRGQIVTAGTVERLTLNQLAAAVQTDRGWHRPPRHIPPSVLALLAATLGRAKPDLRRRIQAALVMDRAAPTAAPPICH